MILVMYKYTCKNCGNVFKAPELPGQHYGEFLLRTDQGEVAYLMAITSKPFNDFSMMLDEDPRLRNYSAGERGTILRAIFGAACDPAPDGNQYAIGRFPPCPKCHSDKMASWIDVYPYEVVHNDVPPITTNKWDGSTIDEKRLLVDHALGEYLASN